MYGASHVGLQVRKAAGRRKTRHGGITYVCILFVPDRLVFNFEVAACRHVPVVTGVNCVVAAVICHALAEFMESCGPQRSR